MTRAAAVEALRAADRALEARVGSPRSVAPGRRRATPLADLGDQLLARDEEPRAALAFADAAVALVTAQLECFPGNLFWDADLAAAALLALARADAAGGTAELVRVRDALVGLHRAFGGAAAIQFRYTHDFVYGYDWARWVRKGPPARAAVGPYDAAFVVAMQERGRELLQLIAADDPKYPRLARGVARNPFWWSREPEHEARLLAALAERGLVPVEAWRADASPRADRDYSALREEQARALGIPPAVMRGR